MKYITIFLLFIIIGTGIFLYSKNSTDIINWNKLNQVLEKQEITTQKDTQKLIIDYFRRGLISQYLNQNYVFLIGSGIFLIISGIFGAIHILIDKLLFKKFFELPNIFQALRRSFLFASMVISLIWMSLQRIITIEIIILIILIFFAIELTFITFKRHEQKKKLQKKE